MLEIPNDACETLSQNLITCSTLTDWLIWERSEQATNEWLVKEEMNQFWLIFSFDQTFTRTIWTVTNGHHKHTHHHKAAWALQLVCNYWTTYLA